MTPTDTHYDLMAGTRDRFEDEEEEEFCTECGFPVDQCECDFDDDEAA